MATGFKALSLYHRSQDRKVTIFNHYPRRLNPPDLDKSVLANRQSVVATSSAGFYLLPDALGFYSRLVYKSAGDAPDPRQPDPINWLDSSLYRHATNLPTNRGGRAA